LNGINIFYVIFNIISKVNFSSELKNMGVISKVELKKQLQEMGVNVVGNYVRKSEIENVLANKTPITVKKGTKIEVDTEKVQQWSERVVSVGEIVNDTLVTSKSIRILCYLEKCGGNFNVPAGEIWLVVEERYLI
jgi:hypothetical protein